MPTRKGQTRWWIHRFPQRTQKAERVLGRYGLKRDGYRCIAIRRPRSSVSKLGAGMQLALFRDPVVQPDRLHSVHTTSIHWTMCIRIQPRPCLKALGCCCPAQILGLPTPFLLLEGRVIDPAGRAVYSSATPPAAGAAEARDCAAWALSRGHVEPAHRPKRRLSLG